MRTAEYRTALDAAIKEYEELGGRRRDIDARLAQLAQTIGTLNRLLGYTPTVPLGLTDACRLALRSGVPMTPLDVRDRLLAIGVDLSVYANPLAAIHTVVKRLHQAGEVLRVPRPPGKPAFLWLAPMTPAALERRDGARVRRGVREAAAVPANALPRRQR